MSLPLVIINPESAGGATRDAWPAIASELASHFGAFAPAFTKGRGDAVEIAANAARKGDRLIIACGGDGTISEVANGILAAGTNAELGILPSGTGGDFRRTIGIPARTADAAKILRTGQTRQIDVGRVAYTKEDGGPDNSFFIGVASVGLSAAVIARVKEEGSAWLPNQGPKWLTGRASYGWAMLQTAVKSSATRLFIQLDDSAERLAAVTNLCVANARYFGGGMKIAPDAKLDDGKFDVVSIGDLSAGRILTNAPRLYMGAHLNMAEVGHALGAKVAVRAANKDERIPLEVDGELPGYLPATFQILPKALRVRCPRQ